MIYEIKDTSIKFSLINVLNVNLKYRNSSEKPFHILFISNSNANANV